MEINIGDRIREVRVKKGYSTYNLSDKSGIPQSTISKLENNRMRFDVETLKKISDALEIPLTTLLGEKQHYHYLNRFYPIGQIVKEFRKKNNLRQEEFAKQCKVDVEYIERLEKGLNPDIRLPRREATISILNRIANSMGQSIEMLALETGYYNSYDDLMYHQMATRYIYPLIKYLKDNDQIIKDRIATFLADYGYDYIEDDFTLDEAKDFYLSEIIDFDYDDLLEEINELGLSFDMDENNNIIYSLIKKPTTIAAHLPDGVELTKEEEKQLDDYIQFILSRREE